MLTDVQIARICHEANRAYCLALSDFIQKHWDSAPQWQRESCINGVRFRLANPYASIEASHENWMEHKRAEGWKHGPVKDEAKKEHPCFVSFDLLPVEQQYKDALFAAVVAALATPIEELRGAHA